MKILRVKQQDGTLVDIPFGVSANTGSDADIATHNTDASAHADIREQISQLSSEKVDKSKLTLGMHTDGLLYVFVDGSPVGNGIELYNGGDVYGYVDSSNNIVLKGKLPDGTYTVKYDMEDGSLVNIGDLAIVAEPLVYTNLVPTAKGMDGNVFNGVGYQRDFRWSSSNTLKESTGSTAIGCMPTMPSQSLTIYVYGLDFGGTTADLVVSGTEISNGTFSNGGYFSNLLEDGFTGTNFVSSVEKLADHYYKITTITVPSSHKYFAISGATVSGITPIVTLNEPIM